MSEEKKAADDLIAISEDLGLYEEPECWIVIEQGKLMTLIRCAMFRDSFLGDRDDFGAYQMYETLWGCRTIELQTWYPSSSRYVQP